jgi:hypothetical protein
MPVFGAIVLRYIPVMDGEALGLLGLGYRQIFIAELYCYRHGTIRTTTEIAPDEHQHLCPLCLQPRPSSGVLCTGYTKRPDLQAYEFFTSPVSSWPTDDDQIGARARAHAPARQKAMRRARYLRDKARMGVG